MKYPLQLKICLLILMIQVSPLDASTRESNWSHLTNLPDVKKSLPTAEIEKDLLSDVTDHRLDDFSLLHAMLLADGCYSKQQLQKLEQRLSPHFIKLSNSTKHSTASQKAKLTLEYLHQYLITGKYQENCSSVRIAIDQGDYNCVSSAVLYAYFARKLDLRVSFEKKPGHVYCIVRLRDVDHPVETTSPNWEKSQLAAVKNRTICRSSLTDAQMISLVYYNRGVALFQQHQYAKSIAQNYIALKFDPDSKTASGNILSALNNWALDLYENGEFQKATHLLNLGISLDHTKKSLLTSEAFIYNDWLDSLCNQQQYHKALSILQSIPNRAAHRQFIARKYLALYRGWAADLLASGKTQKMFQLLDNIPSSQLSPSETQKIQITAINQHVSKLLDQNQKAAANRLIQKGLIRFPNSALLKRTVIKP